MLFDTHAHYDDDKIFSQSHKLIMESYENDIIKIVNVADSLKSGDTSREFAEKFDFVYCTAGIHPSDAVKDMQNKDWQNMLKKQLKYEKCVAIGEIGLDYHYGKNDIEEQKKCFIAQMKLAEELNMPVVVHDRDAHFDIMEIVSAFDNVKGVMHSFSGSGEMAKEILKKGWYISVNGVVTFSNAKKICDILKSIRSLHKDALSRLLIETDCPYLTPEPFRGEKNYSRYIKFTAEKAAELVDLDYDEFCKLTFENGCEFYHIKP